MTPVTDPAVLAQLNSTPAQPVTDPAILAQLNGAHAPTEQPLNWQNVPGQALKNFPASAVQLGKNLVTPILHPIQTAENIGDLGAGIIEKFVPSLPQGDIPVANAVGQYFVNRYGGMDQLKNTIAKDPAGFMADASVVLGGGTAALKATGALGAAADAAETTASLANPITTAGYAASKIAAPVGKLASEGLGLTTGSGAPSIQAAYGAGLMGGDQGAAFLGSLRGTTPMSDVVQQAQGALSNLRRARSEDYTAGMGAVSADPTVLDLSPVDQAVSQSGNIGTFKGQTINPAAVSTQSKIADALTAWKALPPDQFHTAEGLDALKQQIGGILEDTKPGTQADLVAKTAYNAIKDQIVQQAPQYAAVMQNYGDASDALRDLSKTFSLGPTASTDTTVRKLQSVLRNNVSTDYGRRYELAQELAESGAPNLLPSIAGQSLSPIAPRGLGRAVSSGDLLGALTAFGAGDPKVAAAMAATLPLTSPRLIGEGAYALGRLTGKLPKMPAWSNATALAQALGQTDYNSPAFSGAQQ